MVLKYGSRPPWQLTILGVANDVGENVGVLSGIACNKLPPWVVLSVGPLAFVLVSWAMVFFGLLLARLFSLCLIGSRLLWIALCIATNSSAWFRTAVLVTNMRNFPLSRGTVAGILKGYIGLSAAIYTEVYTMVLDNSASKLLLFLTLGIPVVSLAMMYLIRSCTPTFGEDSSVHVHFLFTQAASITLAIYLLTTTILKDVFFLSNSISYILVAVMVILLLSPIAIPIKMTLFPANPKKPAPPIDSSDDLVGGEGNDDSNQMDPLLVPSSSETYLGSFYEGEDISDVDMLLAVGEGVVKKKRKPKRGEDYKFREAIVKAEGLERLFGYFLGIK
ncbi:hypothetical protein U1Q18_050562 [Sarracenia purpurea var. burkii]